MIQQLNIDGVRPGANDCLWKHWRVFDKIKADQQRDIAYYIRKCQLKPMRWTRLEFFWFEPNRHRDIDNVMFAQKFVLDALVQTGILEDDGWEQVKKITHHVIQDPEYPGVTVYLSGKLKGGEEVMATKKPVKKVAKKAVKKPFKASVSKKSKPVVEEAVVVDHY